LAQVREGKRVVSAGMSDTLIILDWDDTVIPTTFLSENHCAPEELATFAAGAEKLLQTALKYGQVVLCTNAELWWPQSSAWTYFPGLCKLLAEIPVVSAQANFAPLGYTDPFDWKRLAFEQIVSSYGAANVISIGDAWYERSAVILACRALAESAGQPVCCKSLKFLDQPNLSVLSRQQAAAVALLQRVVGHQGCLDIFLPGAEHLEQVVEQLTQASSQPPEGESTDSDAASTRPSTATPPTPAACPAAERKRRKRARKKLSKEAGASTAAAAPLPQMPFNEDAGSRYGLRPSGAVPLGYQCGYADAGYGYGGYFPGSGFGLAVGDGQDLSRQ